MRLCEILGHERAIDLLERTVSSGRVAHSYIFAGPEGVGKRLAAAAFASALNCAEPGADACGKCASCEAIDSGAHINFLTVEPLEDEKKPDKGKARVIKIEQIRELQKVLRYTVDSGRRVAMVDRADSMLVPAQNAFLKTLEEPPGGCVIILVTSQPSALLPTIQSRCHRVNFAPLDHAVISGELIKRHGVEGAEAGLIARLSMGSLAAAFEIADGDFMDTRRMLLDTVTALDPSDRVALLDAAQRLAADSDLIGHLDILRTWYRDLVVLAEGRPELMVNYDMEDAARSCAALGQDRLLDCFDLVTRTRRSIMPPQNANKRLAVESLFLSMVAEPVDSA